MNTFSQAVESWHDYYHVFGDAAAALMGLLFVSVSLNANLITRKSNADLRQLAGQTFSDFMCVLMFAVLFLIPDQGPRGLGLPMLGIGLIVLYFTVNRILKVSQTKQRNWGSGGVLSRFALPTLCFITIIFIAVMILMGYTWVFYLFVPVDIMLIWDASINAWNLLLRLHEPRQEA